jgi:hypothetical protein
MNDVTFYAVIQRRGGFMRLLKRTIIAGLFLGIELAGALAQTPPPPPKTPAPEVNSRVVAPPHVRRAAYARRLAQCRAEARAKKFGIHFVKRNRFIHECLRGRRTST